MTERRRFIFCFDVCCPYAYVASQRMARIATSLQRWGLGQVEWRPTLLGGLYAGTKAPQGKDGSAMDVMAANKLALFSRDLRREAERWQVPLHWNQLHPIKTLEALRLLCGIHDMEMRARLALALYEAYWVKDLDVSDRSILLSIAEQQGINNGLELLQSEQAKQDLKENTDWLLSKGGFGVPSIIATNESGEERMFFGQDRTFFALRHMGVPNVDPLSHPLRLLGVEKPPEPPNTTLFFYHDFSSPWSFLGSTQVSKLAQSHGATLVFKPILLGALFRAIGTPNVPMFAMPEAKRAYFAKDMGDWAAYHGGIDFRFPDGFPIRTVLPLRVSIVEPKTTHVLYTAAWVEGKNIGEEEILKDVLSANGFDADALCAAANNPSVKDELKNNTEEAQLLGGCGVPTYRVNDSELIWGQDRMNVVSDMLAMANANAKLPKANL